MKYVKIVLYILLLPGYQFLTYVLRQYPSTQKYSWDMSIPMLVIFLTVVWFVYGIKLVRKTIKLN